MICFFKKQAGFSLIELVVVCLLISILLSIGIPSYMNAKHNADKQKAIFNLYSIYQAQKLFYFDQDPLEYTNQISDLTPDYATISLDDGTWDYAISGFSAAPNSTYIAQALHKIAGGAYDGNSLTIDQTGTIDETNWPY